MNTSDFYYDLPEELIAQFPVEPRDSSRLMVVGGEGVIEHRTFYEIIDYLREGDVLVVNETKVLPARLLGRKDTGANVEIFLLKRLALDRYECLVNPGRRLKKGAKVLFDDVLTAYIEEELESGNRIVRFECEGTLEAAIEKVGHTPVPPYISSGYDDIKRYNTVYASAEGSSAAPTAGLHFTDALMAEIEKKGIRIVKVVLHVGLGTFRPVKVRNILDHHMHSEWYEISEEAADAVNHAKGRVICVGTTSCRAIESAAVLCETEGGKCGGRKYKVQAGSGDTEIFIYPGYEFKIMDALITNFHLPESTLIMLVSAYAGREETLRAYREAVSERYRFFSFGDAMFLHKDAVGKG
ncbi:MAG: tRNA preQ1(34) S-adenosylmethionine ribosyltransferase-isomerase QueA [Bacillota bacterium]|nr:tRNA preQ1(34) S-adenosylmethionine ribosyltransferase-isomerase QueA [Bacillota bacterium]